MESPYALISALPDAALILSHDLIVVSSNEPMNALLESDPKGEHITSFFRAPSVLQAAKAALTTGEKSNVKFTPKVRSSRSFDVFVSAFEASETFAKNVLLIVRDLTYQQQIERMRSDFVANASHELRTPLASISGFIETLQGSAKNDPKARAQFLGVMKAQADRMSQLIDDLLSLSRIELTEHVAPHAEADLAAIARSAVDLLSSLTKENNCAIVVSLPAKLPVIGDSSQLSQVMFNLIENALKYGGRGQKIEIDGRVAGTHVMLSVRDHGAGIAPEDVPRLTERFYRVNVQDSRMRGGTGLGLAIVKHILNRHRGRLEIQSELGNGSAFSIYIPKFN